MHGRCAGGTPLLVLRPLPRVTGVPSSSYVIEYDGTFTFPVPVAQLWATLVHVDRFPSWWSWLHEFSVEGEGLERGTVLHGIAEFDLVEREQAAEGADIAEDRLAKGLVRKIADALLGPVGALVTHTGSGVGDRSFLGQAGCPTRGGGTEERASF